MGGRMSPDIRHFFHEQSGTLSYVVSDPASGAAAVIDPVLGFSVVSGRSDTKSAEEIVAYIKEKQLTVDWILETHAHADHISAAQFLKAEVGGSVAIGEGICRVQAHFGPVFNLPVTDFWPLAGAGGRVWWWRPGRTRSPVLRDALK